MGPKKAKYPCGTCSKSAATNSLLCNFCDMWHHATVECIPWHTKETINTLLEICKEQSCWTCMKCSNIMKKMNGRLAALEKDVKEVKDDVKSLQTKQDSADKVVTELQGGMNQLKKSVTERSNTVTSEIYTEIKEREDRRCNVIVSGIAESEARNKDDVFAEERNHLTKLFDDLEMNSITTSENVKFKTRLGKREPDKGPRPFLLKFHNANVRDDVLRNARKVSNSGIRIKPDLTKKEREEDEKFKKNVDDENNKNPTDESGDFRWKVAGPPGNLRKVKMRNVQEWEETRRTRVANRVA